MRLGTERLAVSLNNSVAEQLRQIPRKVVYTIVSEAGASVYSASDIARQEFPDYQVEERSAVSIARRLQDPLAELVKNRSKSRWGWTIPTRRARKTIR